MQLSVVVMSIVIIAVAVHRIFRAKRRLRQLTDAALAIASGKLDMHIDVKSFDEIGKLAVAFNTMTDELRTYIEVLQESRDELKRNLARLGDTLSSTHDLKKMLAVIVETAMVTIRAEAGALMLYSGNRDELYLKVGRGLDGRLSSASVRVAVGEGVAGRVAQTGEGVHGLVGPDAQGELRLSPSEPRADSVIAVPLKSQSHVIGVLNLYDRIDSDAFDDNDLATIRSFANQATVAIDNVLLHQEAQRLSNVDARTGLWNSRYFDMAFDQAVDRHTKTGLPLSLLVIDVDNFKAVNDSFGHAVANDLLAAFAARLGASTREDDLVARWGGDEFVVLLADTAHPTAQGIANDIIRSMAATAFETPVGPVSLTGSAGVATMAPEGLIASGRALFEAADRAMYLAKANGRNGTASAESLAHSLQSQPA